VYGIPPCGKGISRDALAALLAALPPDTILAPNAVGNLIVTNVAGDYLGYINIAEEETNVFNTEGG
jgi:hypothetical protein